MRIVQTKVLLGVIAAVVVAWMGLTPVHAQEVATAKSRVRMVRAFCTTGPCDAGFTFQSGSAHINRMKQPKPISKRKLGKIRILGLEATTASVALPSSLEAVVTARFLYDTVDPDGDCPNLGSDSVERLATSSMFCRANVDGRATCGGDLLLPLGTFDTRCTDVRVTMHDLDIEVFEFGMVGTDSAKIATQGISLIASEPDCSSGGSGCP